MQTTHLSGPGVLDADDTVVNDCALSSNIFNDRSLHQYPFETQVVFLMVQFLTSVNRAEWQNLVQAEAREVKANGGVKKVLTLL